jgi:hypothetical protein
MHGLTGGSWKRSRYRAMATEKNNPTGNRAVPNGSVTYHRTMPPRQLSTLHRRANVRRLFNRLNRWIVRRIWGWRFKRWRNAGWRTLPETRLYGEYGLVNLLQLIPSMREYYRQKGYTH